MRKIPKLSLYNGVDMPILGLGVYQINTLEDMKRAVDSALGLGYRLFDTAAAYANEGLLGTVLSQGGIDREELFVTSKIFRSDVRKGFTQQSFKRSLQALRMDYLDLCLIHWPVRGYERAWEELYKLYDEGLVRAIGVSNFCPEQMEILEKRGGIRPMVDQVEFHPLQQQTEIVNYCRDKGIVVQAYGPFMQGELLGNEVILALGGKYQCSAAQIILQWIVSQGISVIPKSITPRRIEENAEALEIAIGEKDSLALKAMDQRKGSLPEPYTFW